MDPYFPTPKGRARPAPPPPDTPNTGRVAFPTTAPKKTLWQKRPTLAHATEAVVLGWVVFDVAMRLF